MTVSIPFSAEPNQILDAFRRIQEEARKTNRELKSLGDVDFPGLEDAKRQLQDMQRGFEQMFSKAIRTNAAGDLRSGSRNGVYDKDVVSWLSNVQKQFPDQKDLVRHLKSVIEQSARIGQHIPAPYSPVSPTSPLPAPAPSSPLPNPSMPLPGGGKPAWTLPNYPVWGGTLPGGHVPPIGSGMRTFPTWGGTLPGGGMPGMPYPQLPHIPGQQPGVTPGGPGWYGGPGMGAALGGLMSGNIGGIAGGAMGGLAGGPIGAMVGATIGSKLQAAIGKYAEQSMQEAFGMSDLRRSVYGINEEFGDFRKNIRAAGDGLGVTYNETLAMSRAFAQLSSLTGSGGIASGTRAGIALSRQFGLDPSQGASMMGRMAFLGLGGGDPKKQAQMLAEAMAGSNLGARQSDAAEAMIRFAERSASMIGDGGNVAGYTGRLLALFNSSDKGVRANAAGILGGYDESVRAGGRAGDAGKNFFYNVMSRNGTADPFDIEMALEGGFSGKMGNGKMIGPELLRHIRSRYSGMGSNAMASATKGLFGGSASVAKKTIESLIANPNMSDSDAAKKVSALMADLRKDEDGKDLRIASANLNNAAQKLLGDNMLPVMTKMSEVLGDLTNAINDWIGKKPGSAAAKEFSELDASRQQSSRFKQWGDFGGKQWMHRKVLPTESSMRSFMGNPGAEAFPSGFVDEMSRSPGSRRVDSEFMQSVSDLAGKHKIKYMAPASERGSAQQIGITGGNQVDAEKFSKAVDKLANMVGFKVDVKVVVDKNGNAIKRPSNNPSR